MREKIFRDSRLEVRPNTYSGEDIVLPDGKGVRLDQNGEFMGFLDP